MSSIPPSPSVESSLTPNPDVPTQSPAVTRQRMQENIGLEEAAKYMKSKSDKSKYKVPSKQKNKMNKKVDKYRKYLKYKKQFDAERPPPISGPQYTDQQEKLTINAIDHGMQANNIVPHAVEQSDSFTMNQMIYTRNGSSCGVYNFGNNTSTDPSIGSQKVLSVQEFDRKKKIYEMRHLSSFYVTNDIDSELEEYYAHRSDAVSLQNLLRIVLTDFTGSSAAKDIITAINKAIADTHKNILDAQDKKSVQSRLVYNMPFSDVVSRSVKDTTIFGKQMIQQSMR